MRDRATAQRGVTLLELSIVVAIVGVLAAVVIPNWASTARNAKYDPEISAMFAELAMREEFYKSEIGNGLYLTAPVCPSTPNPNGINFNTACVTAGSPWATMRVSATDSAIRCTYAVTAGPTGTPPAPPAVCAAAPAGLVGSWYFIVATCDMAGNGGTNATFCATSWNTQQNKANYGS